MDDIKSVEKKDNWDQWKILRKESTSEESTPSLNQVCLGCANTEAEADHHAVQAKEDLLRILTTTDGTDEKQNQNTRIFFNRSPRGLTTWEDMTKNVSKSIYDLWEKSVSA